MPRFHLCLLFSETDQDFQIITIACTGCKVLVGTDIGIVAIFDSESTTLLKYHNWHKKKVRSLLIMPKQVEPCICAEIPFCAQQESPDAVDDSVLVTSVGNGKRGLLHKKEDGSQDIVLLTWWT